MILNRLFISDTFISRIVFLSLSYTPLSPVLVSTTLNPFPSRISSNFKTNARFISFSSVPFIPTAPPSGAPCGASLLCFKNSSVFLFLFRLFLDLFFLHIPLQLTHEQAQSLVFLYFYILIKLLHGLNLTVFSKVIV